MSMIPMLLQVPGVVADIVGFLHEKGAAHQIPKEFMDTGVKRQIASK